jgi:hypothetical protein
LGDSSEDIQQKATIHLAQPLVTSVSE